MLFHSTLSRIGVAAMAAVCGYAWVRGRRPERLTAVVLALAWVASEVLEDFNGAHAAQPIVFGLDVGFCGFLFWLLVSSRREWLVWAFTYQSLVVLTHLAVILDPYADRWTFFTAYLVWSYLELAALAIGTTLEARRPRLWPKGPQRRSSGPKAARNDLFSPAADAFVAAAAPAKPEGLDGRLDRDRGAARAPLRARQITCIKSSTMTMTRMMPTPPLG